MERNALLSLLRKFLQQLYSTLLPISPFLAAAAILGDPPVERLEGPELVLRSYEPQHGGEEAQGVQDGEADGAEHEDPELREEEDVREEQEHGGSQGGAGSGQDRDPHLIQSVTEAVEPVVVDGATVAFSQVNHVVNSETHHQHKVQRLKNL